jgi:hypothetical protein
MLLDSLWLKGINGSYLGASSRGGYFFGDRIEL